MGGQSSHMPCTIKVLPVVRREALVPRFRGIRASRGGGAHQGLADSLDCSARWRRRASSTVRWWHCIGPTWISHGDGSQSGTRIGAGSSRHRRTGGCASPTHGAVVRSASRVPSSPWSQRVLCKDDGRPLSRQSAWTRVRRAVRLAGVPTGVHILRHTFCSHLAMQGAPGKSDSGAGGTPGDVSHAGLHAPES